MLLLSTGCPLVLTTAGFPPACISLDTPLHDVPLHHMQNSDDSLAGFVQCKKKSHVVSLSSLAVLLSDNLYTDMTIEMDT